MTVCTTWHPAGYKLYGHNFLTSFEKHWPKSIELGCWVEGAMPSHRGPERQAAPRAQFHELGHCDGIIEFIGRNSGRPEVNGRIPNSRWTTRERVQNYAWRYDAVRFCRQLFVPEACADYMHDGDVLCWLDADVLTFRDVPEGFVEGLLGDADACHLGRNPQCSEIGFWAVRLNERSRPFVVSLAETYRSGHVFTLPEFHSGMVFDHCLRAAAILFDLRVRNLTPNGKGHVWFQSPLCHYTDHLKGDRKKAGRSHERTRGIA